MNDRHFLRRAGALLLSFAAVSVLFSASVTVRPVEAAGEDDAYNQKLVYKWHRIYKYTDLPAPGTSVKCILCWVENGVPYCTLGNELAGEKDDWASVLEVEQNAQSRPDGCDRVGFVGQPMTTDRYLDSAMLGRRDTKRKDGPHDDTYGMEWASEFITTDDRGCWSMKTQKYEYADKEQTSVNAVQVCLYRQNGDRMYAKHEDGDNTFFSSTVENQECYVRIYTGDMEKHAGHDVTMNEDEDLNGKFDKGYTSLQIERGGGAIDYYYHFTDRYLMNDNFDNAFKDSHADSMFVMYVCEEPEVMAIKADYTVPTGVTFQFKNDAYLENGVTLTIEPGAVVSLDGTFFSNGIIRNYGTLILHEGATLAYYDPKNKAGSSLYNYGSDHSVECKTINKTLPGEGNVIVMKGARLLLQFADRPSVNAGYVGPSLYFSKGSTLVNYGFVSSPFSTRFEGAHIVLNEGSMFLTRVNFEKRLGTLYEVTKDTYNNYSPLNVSTPGVEFVGTANYIEYYGEWKDQKTDMLSTFEADPNVTVRKVR